MINVQTLITETKRILAKVTAENVDELAEKFARLPENTMENLDYVVYIFFEKVIGTGQGRRA